MIPLARYQRVLAPSGGHSLEAIFFERDPVRVGLLQGFLERHRCRLVHTSDHALLETLPLRPDLAFVTTAIVREGRADLVALRTIAPEIVVIALTSSEHERMEMLEAGVDHALCLPSDLQELAVCLEGVRARRTPEQPANEGPFPREVVEWFVGEVPELIADITDGIARRDVAAVRLACERLHRRALALGGIRLSRLSRACSALARTEDFTTAASFERELELEFASMFERLVVGSGRAPLKTAEGERRLDPTH